jgi:hypothetical protein
MCFLPSSQDSAFWTVSMVPSPARGALMPLSYLLPYHPEPDMQTLICCWPELVSHHIKAAHNCSWLAPEQRLTGRMRMVGKKEDKVFL